MKETKNYQTIKNGSDMFTTVFRSLRYSKETALYELIDNSIKAKASQIDIKFNYEDEIKDSKIVFYKGTLVIKDNGGGMTLDEIKTSMNLADKKRIENLNSDEHSSYFGMGMKTSAINLANEDGTSTIYITSLKDGNITKIKWNITNDETISRYEILENAKVSLNNSFTEIKITNVVLQTKNDIKEIVDNIGTTYYPVLTANPTLKITYNFNIKCDTEKIYKGIVKAEDPLYRECYDRLPIRKSIAKIVYNNKTYEIPIVATYLAEDSLKQNELHKWDKKDGRDRGHRNLKRSFLYINYGGRFIERGNNAVLANISEQYVNAGFRCMFTIPKELTKLFNINFNKTDGTPSFAGKGELFELCDIIRKFNNELVQEYSGTSTKYTRNKLKNIQFDDNKIKINVKPFDNSRTPVGITYGEKGEIIITFNQRHKFFKKVNSERYENSVRNAVLFSCALAIKRFNMVISDEDKVFDYADGLLDEAAECLLRNTPVKKEMVELKKCV